MKRVVKCILWIAALLFLFGCQAEGTQGNVAALPAHTVLTVGTQEEAGEETTPEPSEKSTAPAESATPSTASPPAETTALKEEEPEPVEEDPYFMENGQEEFIRDEKSGHWLYRSGTLYVKVTREFNKKKVQTCFVAEVRLKEGEREIAGFSRRSRPGSGRQKLYVIARDYRAVIAVNGDYMHVVEPTRKGIIIRNGKVYTKNKAADTLAFYPDGSMRIFKPGEITAKKLLADGVKNTFSFGPTLVENGKIVPGLQKKRLSGRHPRTAVGMVEPGHFILVVADGRSSRYSKGMTFEELAKVFTDHGCTLAYNLDGGASATMTFMGKNISKYGGSRTGQRKVPDALLFGKCDSVPKK